MAEPQEEGADHHYVDGALYLCHEDDHYCPEGKAARRYADAVNAPLSEQAAAYIAERIRNGTAPRIKVRRKGRP